MGSSKENERYEYLDGWRGYSILAVLLGHYLILPGINTGRFGVEMFFVLSGRLMGEILFLRKSNLPIFFKRRISRVWPALFVLVFLSWFFFSSMDGPLHVTPAVVLSCMTFTYNYAQLYMGQSPALDHIWSLCIEEHIYILLGAVAFLSRKYGLPPVPILLAIILLFVINGVVQTYFFDLDYYKVYWRTDTRGASILMSAVLFVFIEERRIRVQGWVPLVFAFLGVLLFVNKVPDPIKYSVGTLCLALSICTVRSLSGVALRFLSSPTVRRVGVVSFSLYLWQQPFYKLIGVYPTAALFCCAVLAGLLSYSWVEVPVRRYLNENWAR